LSDAKTLCFKWRWILRVYHDQSVMGVKRRFVLSKVEGKQSPKHNPNV